MQKTKAECPTCRREIHVMAHGDTCDFYPGFNATCHANDGFKCSIKMAIEVLKVMDPSATVTRHKAQ